MLKYDFIFINSLWSNDPYFGFTSIYFLDIHCGNVLLVVWLLALSIDFACHL